MTPNAHPGATYVKTRENKIYQHLKTCLLFGGSAANANPVGNGPPILPTPRLPLPTTNPVNGPCPCFLRASQVPQPRPPLDSCQKRGDTNSARR